MRHQLPPRMPTAKAHFPPHKAWNHARIENLSQSGRSSTVSADSRGNQTNQRCDGGQWAKAILFQPRIRRWQPLSPNRRSERHAKSRLTNRRGNSARSVAMHQLHQSPHAEHHRTWEVEQHCSARFRLVAIPTNIAWINIAINYWQQSPRVVCSQIAPPEYWWQSCRDRLDDAGNSGTGMAKDA